MKISPLFLICFLTLTIFSTSCDKKDPDILDEPELITTFIYTLTSDNGGSPVIFSFRDLDGDGGDNPVVLEESLAANTVYNGRLSLLNEQEDPAKNITEEIQEEDEDHQFFFTQTLNNTSITYADMDSDNNPIGLSTVLTTGEAESETMTITLRHEPNKTADGVAGGSITNAGGETDIEVTFSVNVE